jgi:hypothetical protein
MPKVNMDYSRTIIYKIVCKDLLVTDLYIGHTTNFIKRKQQHKSSCNNENNKKYNLLVYQTIRNNCGWDNWEMIEVEKYTCNDVNEALKQERFWIETLKATLNKYIPSRTIKEWYLDNKEEKKEYKKEYYLKNKEHIKEYQKEYKEQIKEYKKEYYLQNKEHIKEQKSKKIICDCGGNYTHNHKARHFNSKRHSKYLDNLEDI